MAARVEPAEAVWELDGAGEAEQGRGAERAREAAAVAKAARAIGESEGEAR